MKLYMVTDGEYSDYCVRGIYSTQEKAEWAKKLYAASNDIQEIEVDALPQHPDGMLNYRVQMDRDGNTASIKVRNAEYARDGWEPYGDGDTVAFSVWARDEQHAVKIANERRTKLVATNQWTTDWEKWKAANK